MVKFGPQGTESATAADSYAPKPRAIRQQPKGLKPRFTPIGVPKVSQPASAPVSGQTRRGSEGETDSDSDEEMTEAPPPNGVSTPIAANSKLKRKHAPEEIAQQAAATKEAKSNEKGAKRHKSNKSVASMTPTSSSQARSAATSAMKETPIPAPSLAAAGNSSLETPSKTKKEKKEKNSSSKEKTSKTSQTPIPPPPVPRMSS